MHLSGGALIICLDKTWEKTSSEYLYSIFVSFLKLCCNVKMSSLGNEGIFKTKVKIAAKQLSVSDFETLGDLFSR